MKKFFFLATAALGMMASCQKPDIDVADDPIDDSSQVAVQFSIDAPSLTLTKLAGPIDAWSSQKLYILGYERTTASYKLENALIPNIEADAPASTTSGAISVVHPSGDIDPKTQESIGGEPYYYEDNKVYDFYGYYVDDAAESTELNDEESGVSIAIELDGTQDIMVAKADPNLDVKGEVLPRNAYSAYAARRNVQPTLTFEHMLARFNFYVVAGAESGTKVKVTKITLDSYDEATLNIAPTPGLATTATSKKNFELAGVGPDEVPFANGDYTYDVANLLENESGKIGNSIMAIPGESAHTIMLSTEHLTSNQSIADLEIPLNASDIKTKDGKVVKAFQAGYQYDIILTVYGPEEVKITAVLSEWKDGGNTVVDPDKWFEEQEQPEPSAKVTSAEEGSTVFTITAPAEAKAVRVGYSISAEVAPESWKPATATKADFSTWTAEFGFTGQYNYYLHVDYTVDNAPAEGEADQRDWKKMIEPVAFTSCAPIQNFTLDFVNDKKSYYSVLWESWLVNYPWSKYEYEGSSVADILNLPWIVVKYKEVGNEEKYTMTFKKDGEVMTLVPGELNDERWTVDQENNALVVNHNAFKDGIMFDYKCFAGGLAAGEYAVEIQYGEVVCKSNNLVVE